MKLFFFVLVVATIVGGFSGGEVTGKTFSIIGAAVGGVGTATALLSLGAHFTAQDEKRKRRALSPEMRGVFDRMLGSPAQARAVVSAAQKWRPRPFHRNRTRSEYEEWFAHAGDWRYLDRRLIKILIDRLQRNPMFEVFVHASQDCSIVAQYRGIGSLFDIGVGDVAACPRVADILCAAGVANATRLARCLTTTKPNPKELERLYRNAMNALEAAIHVEPRYVLGYLRLAEFKKLIGKKGEAIKYCEQGLAQIEAMRPYPLPSRPGLELRQVADDVTSALSSLLTELRA